MTDRTQGDQRSDVRPNPSDRAVHERLIHDRIIRDLMGNRRWWDLAFVFTTIVTMTLLAVGGLQEGARLGAMLTMLGLSIAYAVLGRFTIGEPLGWRSAAWVIVMVAAVGIGVAFEPNMSFLQAVLFPCLWVAVARDSRMVVIANLLMGLAVFLGFVVGLGPEQWLQGLAAGGLSVVFSLAIGMWITRIARYGGEHARLLAELTAAQEQLTALHREAGVMSERARLSREIHDTIAQSLTSVVMLAQRGQNDARSDVPASAVSALELIETTARDALGEARALVASTSPIGAGDGSLAETITRLGDRFQRETGVRVTTRVSVAALPRELEVVLLRCAQEGLANVRKHASANAVSITAEHAAEEVVFRVRDDGRGFGGAVGERGFGLSGMQDRVALVGGRLDVAEGADAGVELTVVLPAPRTS